MKWFCLVLVAVCYVGRYVIGVLTRKEIDKFCKEQREEETK